MSIQIPHRSPPSGRGNPESRPEGIQAIRTTHSVGDHWGPIISLTLVEVLQRMTVDIAQSLCLMRQLSVPVNPKKRAVQLLFSEDSGRTGNACFFFSHAFSFTFNFIRDGLHGISAKQSDTTYRETLLIGLTQANVF